MSASGHDTLEVTIAGSGGDEPSETTTTRRRRPRLDVGTVIGRYVILARLGAGGMGVVYVAHDPDLDRRVALKLLHPGRTDDTTGKARLLREAQALAKLSHPNVVAVHDVGTHDGRVWLAMEFIEGQTLARWLVATPRRVREILDVIVQVGQGVAAAHRAGLLHRDLKPENVMIDAEGRARVMDFGLARSQDVLAEESPGPGLDSSGGMGGSLSISLTEHGAMLGTPAYMAPEQFRGQGDARSDQFALCVTWWEALYGERPFQGNSVPELSAAVIEGERAPIPPGRRVPAWVRRICERGLAREPARRWPSVDAMVAAIERGRRRARLRWVGLGLLVVLLGAGTAYAAQRIRLQQRVAACERAGAEIEAIWGDDARPELRAALLATGDPAAEQTAERVMPWLDEQADAWRRAQVEVCRHAEVEQTWSTDLRERAQWCLDNRRTDLAEVIDALSKGGPTVVERAVSAVTGLQSVDPCLDVVGLERLPFPPLEQRARVQALGVELSRAAAFNAAGIPNDGLELVDEIDPAIRDVGWPPLTAQLHLQRGLLLREVGRFGEAETALADGYFEAARAHAEELTTATALALVPLVGRQLARPAEGRHWARLATLGLSPDEDRDALSWATYHSSLGQIHMFEGALDEAQGSFERALSLNEHILGPSHPKLQESLTNLAIVHARSGRYQQAKEQFERVLDLHERTLGPAHPRVAGALNNLGNVLRDLGEYERSRDLHKRALELKRQRLGPRSPDVAMSLQNLAFTYQSMGDLERAQQLLEQAIGITEEALGPKHPDLAERLNNLAIIQQYRKQYAQAESVLRRALAINEEILGPAHVVVGQNLTNLASLEMMQGHLEDALATDQRALMILETGLGPEHPDLAHPLLSVAQIELEQGQASEARAHAERALHLREQAGSSPEAAATARAVLALALWDEGQQRARAQALIEQALTTFREAGSAATHELAEFEAEWIRRTRKR
ncbi:MAG: tetratricopeptide repeat protein [Myxococcales bacterium]|nr:tetratricopeptide repeat protein [Myxococcales bacterium]